MLSPLPVLSAHGSIGCVGSGERVTTEAPCVLSTGVLMGAELLGGKLGSCLDVTAC